MLYFIKGYYMVAFHRLTSKSVMHLLTVTCCCSKCHVLSNLASKLLVDLLYIMCFKGIVSLLTWHRHSSWLNVEALERMPTTLFGRPVRCFIHGHSFVELHVLSTNRYSQHCPPQCLCVGWSLGTRLSVDSKVNWTITVCYIYISYLYIIFIQFAAALCIVRSCTIGRQSQ